MGLLDIFSRLKDIGSKVVKGISDMRNIKGKMVGIIGHFTKPTGPSVKPSDVKDKLSMMPMAKIGIPDPDKLKNYKPHPSGVVNMSPKQREAMLKWFKH